MHWHLVNVICFAKKIGVCCDQGIARIEAVADAPALVFDVDEAAQGRGILDVADEEHLGVDGAGLAFDVPGLFFPGFDLVFGNVAGSDEDLNYVI